MLAPPPTPAPPQAVEATDDDMDEEILDAIAERVLAEARSMPRSCPWCVKSIEPGEAFCSPVCVEKWRKHILPQPGREQVTVSRPAPAAVKKALMLGTRAAQAKRRWLRSRPAAAASYGVGVAS